MTAAAVLLQATVRLVGGDGNALAIVGAVARALKREVRRDAADEWTAAAFARGQLRCPATARHGVGRSRVTAPDVHRRPLPFGTVFAA